MLDHPARVAMHFTHRLGAVVAALLIAALGARLFAARSTRADGFALLAVLALQLSLGISIVVFGVSLCPSRSRTTASPRSCCSRC